MFQDLETKRMQPQITQMGADEEEKFRDKELQR
jgi:hypothetical protein